MARTARTTGTPAAAWFYSQSFHSTTIVPATVTPNPPALYGAETPAETQFYADLLLDAIDPRERLMDALEDERIVAERDLELELDYRAAREGDACGSACGYCGRCA